MQRIALAAFRGVFGLAYLAIGLYWVWMHLSGRGGGFPAFGEVEKELVTAMNNADFFEPAVIVSCLAGGALTLFFYRTAPRRPACWC